MAGVSENSGLLKSAGYVGDTFSVSRSRGPSRTRSAARERTERPGRCGGHPSHRTTGGAIESLIDRFHLIESREIVDLMELREVPSNGRLVKGMLHQRNRDIPLLDLRLQLGAAAARGCGPASVLVVDAGGVNLGLILAGISQA